MSDGKPAAGSIPPLGRRRLTTEEEHLWSLVVRTVRPLRQNKKPVTTARHKAVAPDAARPAKKGTAVTVPRQYRASAKTQLSIVRREIQQLTRGRASIDGRIDLHGMTQAQAHGALRSFLHRAQASGARFVLVITGKGAPNAPRGERGVLRRQVPLWLAQPDLRSCVLGFDVAHVGHGGEGALYVRLRKARA